MRTVDQRSTTGIARALRRAVLAGLGVLGPVLLLGAALACAQARYGDAVVEQGSMTLVRAGAKTPHKQGEPRFGVLYDDLIVVHADSRVVVRTVDGAQLTVGANAAFQVKPFKQRANLGSLRLLFGRIRTSLAEMQQGDQFSMKTAQAVIGVKGTEFVTSVTAQGDTLVVVDETTKVVSLTGLEGPARALTPNLMAAVVNSKPVSDVALVTPEVRKALVLEDLASPVAYQPDAKSLRGEEVLVRTGIVSAKDLVESRRDRATLQDAIPFEEEAPPLPRRYELRPEDGRPLEFNLFLRNGQ